MYQDNDLEQVIARRTIKTPDGKTLEVRMYAPQRFKNDDEEKDDSYCPVQILGTSEEVVFRVGVDAFQAIQLAMRCIGSDLAVMNEQDYDGKLEWLEPGGGLGFPTTFDQDQTASIPPKS
jgi:hypothetical protein